MKKLICVILCAAAIISYNTSSAQLLDKIKNKVKNRADQKVDNTIDKGLDKAEGETKVKTKTEDGETKTKTEGEVTSTSTPQSLKAYSRYDFVPGDKILYSEDFSQDVIGEFPLKWNTNGTGEVVTLENVSGRWLKLTERTKYETPFNTQLTENFTLEFDVIIDFKDDQTVPGVLVNLGENSVNSYSFPGLSLFLHPNSGINVDESRDGVSFVSYDASGRQFLEGKKQDIGTFYRFNHKSIPIHVSIWVQKQRFRAWLNQDKVYDLPKAKDEKVTLKKLFFETTSYGGPQSNYQYFISNIRIAAGLPDTRSKLITEGKWSTTGILFDVNSDKIRPTSYGTLKEIAATLSENGDVKVKIIGHTDSDGDDAKNLELSKKRAAAVKTALVNEFNIDSSRLEADGMGETKPIGDNKTPEGKAQNRRVEFIKL